MNKQWSWGRHAVSAIFKEVPETVEVLALLKGRDNRSWETLASDHDITINQLNRKEFSDLLGDVVHQGIAVFHRKRSLIIDEDTLLKQIDAGNALFILALDGIQDPHNLGACLRSADAAGVDAVIIPEKRSAGLTAAVRKVACGAAETVPVISVVNLTRTLKKLQHQGLWVIGADGESTISLYQTDLSGPIVLVLGGEGKGLRRLTRETCDYLAAIPMTGSVSSLNVSVATGIFLFEALRQRNARQL